MLYKKVYTRVPRADVIRLASGQRDNPKSATLAVQAPSILVMKTFKDFKSL